MADKNPQRLVFLCSGGGGNLAFIHQMIERGDLQDVSLVAVLTDRKCQANEFAESNGVPNYCIDFKDEGQRNLLATLDELEPDLIITTVHKILEQSVIERYGGRLINLHYSLLPAFGGLIGARPVQASLDHGVLFTGVTVHMVDESVDGGRPLVQGVIALQGRESLDDLMQVVFRCGCTALMSAITHILGSKGGAYAPFNLTILGHHCVFNGGESVHERLIEGEEFWLTLRSSLDMRN